MQKKIIYIVGCGRSGTTLLGFALGNAVRTLDLGEVIDFARFHGHPNGFGHETGNYKYWHNILTALEAELGPIDFAALRNMQIAIDSHASVFPLWLLGAHYRKTSYLLYQRYVRSLYDAIQRDEQHDVFVDGSKYPSRLLHLLRIYLDHRIHVIHLIRNPVDLARAFKKSEQSKPKSFMQTMMYFFLINSFSILASLGLGKDRYLRVHYENLISDPERELESIGTAFGIDITPAANKINKGQPLDRGYIFNGNRMRLDDQVVFRKSVSKTGKRKVVETAFEGLSGFLFGNAITRKNKNSERPSG